MPKFLFSEKCISSTFIKLMLNFVFNFNWKMHQRNSSAVNPFHATTLFVHPLKTSERVVWNRLVDQHQALVTILRSNDPY